ncbi:MAG: hypothetical protein QXY76_03300 [Nitrososphaeria archaeon]
MKVKKKTEQQAKNIFELLPPIQIYTVEGGVDLLDPSDLSGMEIERHGWGFLTHPYFQLSNSPISYPSKIGGIDTSVYSSIFDLKSPPANQKYVGLLTRNSGYDSSLAQPTIELYNIESKKIEKAFNLSVPEKTTYWPYNTVDFFSIAVINEAGSKHIVTYHLCRNSRDTYIQTLFYDDILLTQREIPRDTATGLTYPSFDGSSVYFAPETGSSSEPSYIYKVQNGQLVQTDWLLPPGSVWSFAVNHNLEVTALHNLSVSGIGGTVNLQISNKEGQALMGTEVASQIDMTYLLDGLFLPFWVGNYLYTYRHYFSAPSPPWRKYYLWKSGEEYYWTYIDLDSLFDYSNYPFVLRENGIYVGKYVSTTNVRAEFAYYIKIMGNQETLVVADPLHTLIPNRYFIVPSVDFGVPWLFGNKYHEALIGHIVGNMLYRSLLANTTYVDSRGVVYLFPVYEEPTFIPVFQMW